MERRGPLRDPIPTAPRGMRGGRGGVRGRSGPYFSGPRRADPPFNTGRHYNLRPPPNPAPLFNNPEHVDRHEPPPPSPSQTDKSPLFTPIATPTIPTPSLVTPPVHVAPITDGVAAMNISAITIVENIANTIGHIEPEDVDMVLVDKDVEEVTETVEAIHTDGGMKEGGCKE